MLRYFGIITTGLLVLGLLIALSAAGTIELDRPEESELQPIRSSYSTGPTGTRAFYQLLEESGRPVSRWRENYLSLDQKAIGALLIVVGPFPSDKTLPSDEALALQRWIAAGGNVLIVSRIPAAQFGDPVIHSEITAHNPPWYASPELLVDSKSDNFIIQPTDLTRGLKGLALSSLAARMKFSSPENNAEETSEDTKKNGESAESSETPQPSPSPAIPESLSEQENEVTLYAPVIHLGDKDGAILADFVYGKGRVIFLSDPFAIANNGIARGSNLELALNIVNALGVGEDNSARKIIFDEFHHGYRRENNPLVNYFRGTPMPWILLQGLVLSLLILYSYGKRFARPLPLTRIDRHSPLEFVSSMANLQRVARARDLAIENIYSRFKIHLCRRLGLSSRASAEEIVTSLRRQRSQLSEIEVRQALSDGELVLKGEDVDDAHLVKIVVRMRRIISQINKKPL